jgi:hypothetical protein
VEQRQLNCHLSLVLGNGITNIQQINKLCNCYRLSNALITCERYERSERQVMNFLVKALWKVALFRLVKGGFP